MATAGPPPKDHTKVESIERNQKPSEATGSHPKPPDATRCHTRSHPKPRHLHVAHEGAHEDREHSEGEQRLRRRVLDAARGGMRL